MLSRVSDSLYWMSRYLERAEHTARVMEVQYNLLLELSPGSEEDRWARVLRSLGSKAVEGEGARALTHSLASDSGSRVSIVHSIVSARENARQVREQISSEMWEQLNRMFHEVKRASVEDIWEQGPVDFLQAIKEGAHLFQGVTDSTMTHGEGWQFIQLGRYLERAAEVSTLLDVHYTHFQSHYDAPVETADHLEWIGLLKSFTAFEAYCKVFTAEPRPDRIAEFLILHPTFPHSIRFSVDQVEAALTAIGEESPVKRSSRVERIAGRLRAMLGFSQIDEIMTTGLHTYLGNVLQQCADVHSTLHQVYINYSIEAALEV
jgi:uncharacterized alpha-E superfamily protein